jgi:hypothetical protein
MPLTAAPPPEPANTATAGTATARWLSDCPADLDVERAQGRQRCSEPPSRRPESARPVLDAHWVEDRLGTSALDRLTGLFVGTIHAFCFRLPQQRVSGYEIYDVVDDNQLTAFLSHPGGVPAQCAQLDQQGQLFASISAFLKSVDVVENELLDPVTMPDPFGFHTARLRRDY